jgi:hypothetical protein
LVTLWAVPALPLALAAKSTPRACYCVLEHRAALRRRGLVAANFGQAAWTTNVARQARVSDAMQDHLSQFGIGKLGGGKGGPEGEEAEVGGAGVV